MLLAFLNDQIQQHTFQAARQRVRVQRTLWERMRAILELIALPDWETLWRLIAKPGSQKARLVIVVSS